jgi:acetyl esterase/lipase
MQCGFSFSTIKATREFLDTLTFNPMESPDVEVRPGNPGEPPGDWFFPKDSVSGRIMIYFHGGGYAFYAKSHTPMIALIAEASGSKTFALRYRLAPEHPHPAQLEDALAAYRWILATGVPPSQIILGGDSAGGHLTLMLLLELKKLGLPQPALAVGFCPWTDTGNRGATLFANDPYDWVQGSHTVAFSRWYRGNTGLSNEAVSPMYADVTGLAPIYLQAGGREILYDMICDFADEARRQKAEVTLDSWREMTHDFQAYGNFLPESREALLKFGAMVSRYCGGELQIVTREENRFLTVWYVLTHTIFPIPNRLLQ